jgi:signal transduction histidine kinase/CheY-like chemotaxis protein
LDKRSILSRQLARQQLSPDTPPTQEQWARLLATVESTYAEAEETRSLLERSLDISSAEMEQMYALLERSAQDQLMRERARLDAVFRALSDAVFSLDDRGRCALANPIAQTLLPAPKDAPLYPLAHITLGPDESTAQTIFAQLWGALRHGEILRFAHGTLRRGEEAIPVSYSLTPLIEQGQLTGCVLTMRDVTAERAAAHALYMLNEELRATRDDALKASQAKSTFLANMSHELRTPLNAIIGYSELIREDADDEGLESIVTDTRKIYTAATHLLHIINDVLDLSKIEAGKMELLPERFSLRGLLDQLDATIRPAMARQGNTFTITPLEQDWTLHTDRIKLSQTLLNLLSNAAKFTHDGHVSMTADVLDATTPNPILSVTVQDNGIGIAPDRLLALFEPFVQADESTTRKYGGTGLGLSITRRFCQMLGGDVHVTSSPGEGSRFQIMLPLTLPGVMAVDHTRAPQHTSPRDTIATALIIDDDPIVFDLASRFLNPEGFRTLHAASGPQAINLALAERPDVITLDVMMPGTDGWTVLGQLKSDPRTAHIPVIMMTIVAERQRGLALGAADYITKPIDRANLIHVLRRHSVDARHLLIIEDDEQARDMLQRMLETDGWTVQTAIDGVEGLERLRTDPPQLVLLDLMMPRLDGFEVLAHMDRDDLLRKIPVIVLTARDLTPQELTWLRHHTARVLQKGGVALDLLLQQVRDATRRHLDLLE